MNSGMLGKKESVGGKSRNQSVEAMLVGRRQLSRSLGSSDPTSRK
jgi:hypothetical protein